MSKSIRPDEPDRPRGAGRRSRKGERETGDLDWIKVQFGLYGILAGVGILIIAYVLGILDLLLMAMGGSISFGLALVAFLMLLARVAFIGGAILCLLGPSKNHARIWAGISLVLVALSLLESCLGGVSFGYSGPHSSFSSSFSVSGIGWLRWMGGVAAVFVLLFGVVYLFYLRAISLALHDEALAKRTLFLSALGGLAVLVNCAAFGVSVPFTIHEWTAKPGDPSLPSMLGVLGTACNAFGGLLMLGMAAWYVLTLYQVHQAIRKARGD